mgnify:CR=1 FL=1
MPDLSPEAAIEDFLHALRRPTRLLVAISGGSDSTGLLLSLQRAIKTQSFPHHHTLTAATVDHALRPGSADEARAVAKLCENACAQDVLDSVWSHLHTVEVRWLSNVGRLWIPLEDRALRGWQ